MAKHAMWLFYEIWWRSDVFGLKTCCFGNFKYENIFILSTEDWFRLPPHACSSQAVKIFYKHFYLNILKISTPSQWKKIAVPLKNASHHWKCQTTSSWKLSTFSLPNSKILLLQKSGNVRKNGLTFFKTYWKLWKFITAMWEKYEWNVCNFKWFFFSAAGKYILK